MIVSGRERGTARFTTLCYAHGVDLFEAGRFAAGEPVTSTTAARSLRLAGSLN